MTPERWQQINQIFDEALERPAAERAAFIARACEGDEDLRRRVEAMLAADAQADLLIDRPAHEAAAGLLSAGASATHESEILSGHTVGCYRLLREIGRGGMGKVYLAHDERLDRRVALKLLPTRLTGDADRVARFQREARAASALNHPNILTIYDFGQDADRHYIATEFVEGQTLRALISRPGCTLEQALDIAIQMASALDAAHAAGIVHRDIKPENVMLRPDGFVKVLDFGLAKLTEVKPPDWDVLRTRDQESGVTGLAPGYTWATKPGLVMGTLAYMSPEQARGSEVDGRSDLFSLGVVLYEMLTGERPFTGGTPADVLAALIEREPPPLPGNLLAAAADIEARAELQRVVSRALAKPLEKRYQTAGELFGDLKGLKQELDFTAKLRSDSAAKSLRVSRQAPADQPPSLSGQATARLAVKAGFWRGAGRLTAWVLAVLALLTVGGALGARWLSGRSSAINSVAVLPFVNVGNDPQTAYLPDGITESLIGSLSQLPGLRVMARNTVFTYKGREVDPRQVGTDLQVRAVVTGRVQRQGERLIIRAELADAGNGLRLWGDEYEPPLTDLLTVEREITREISAALRLRLSGAEQRQLDDRQSANSEAYQLYLKGNYLFHQGSRETQTRALDCFNQAVALDPRYALAYAGISTIYAVFSSQYLAPGEAIPRAREAALKAVELNERLPEAHHALAHIKFYSDWDWAGAERECKRAIELNPNFADAFIFYAGLLSALGRTDEALRAARRAAEFDLFSPAVAPATCNALYFARQYDRVIEESRKALELNPPSAHASGMHRYLGVAFHQKRMTQEAIAELRQAVALNPSDANRSWLAYVCAAVGQKSEALEILRGLEAQAARRHVSPVSIAKIYVGLGDKERALVWLRKGYDERSDHVLILGADPTYDPLRSDPRFIELLRGIGLTP